MNPFKALLDIGRVIHGRGLIGVVSHGHRNDFQDRRMARLAVARVFGAPSVRKTGTLVYVPAEK